MDLEIRWTEEAEFTFDTIVEIIKEKCGTTAGNKFINKTKRLLVAIANQPFIFPESGIDNVRKAVITKQSSLFYEIQDGYIMLLFFWDNRQDPLFF